MGGFMAPQPNNFAASTPGQTLTGGLSYPGGNDDLKAFFMDLARRKYAAQQRPAGPPAGARNPMIGARGVDNTAENARLRAEDEHRQDREHALQRQQKDEAYEDERRVEEMSPAPMHYITQAGQTFLDPDVKRMSGFQRKLFLPENAAIEGGYTPPATAAQDLSAGGGRPAIEAGAPEDESWRRQAFMSQNPYASGLMDKFRVLPPEDDPNSSMYRRR